MEIDIMLSAKRNVEKGSIVLMHVGNLSVPQFITLYYKLIHRQEFTCVFLEVKICSHGFIITTSSQIGLLLPSSGEQECFLGFSNFILKFLSYDLKKKVSLFIQDNWTQEVLLMPSPLKHTSQSVYILGWGVQGTKHYKQKE